MNQYLQISEQEFEEVCQHFSFRKFRKHQFILQEGDSCTYETFLLKGCTRTYRVNDKGDEYILELSIENNWVINPDCSMEGQLSKFNVDCLEEVEALQISKQSLKELYKRVPKFESYIRL
ncbi:MAG TPA: cyclic nucleotide-binding domain-containing protein, partial [Flavisolibacter sp.]|nr:cyclic nucleotide-binding domain-containing protein [Flavisolibacter sp.]